MLRLALREIRNHPRFAAFFVLNLALGFTGFAVLDAFEASVADTLEARSRAFLGADVDVSSSRPLTAEETARLDALAGGEARVATATALFSMAGTGDRARLVELYAVDPRFPLYGAIELEGAGRAAPDARRALEAEYGLWIDPVLRGQLGVEVGDPLAIGDVEFRIQDVVDRDGGRATSGFSIAPRVYLSQAWLAETGLVALGSRVRHRRLYRLPPGQDAVATAQALAGALSDPRVEVRSHVESTREIARGYAAVSDYLGLVALVAVFLAGLGAAHAFRAYLARRVKDIAILLCLGATRARAQATYLLQLALLAVAAGALACGLGAALLPMATRIGSDLLPEGFAPHIGWRTFALVVALAFAGSASACLPLLSRIRSLRPAQLFAEHATPALAGRPREALWALPALLAFWGLAVWRAQSLVAGSAFVALLAVSVVLLGGLALGLLHAAARLSPKRSLVPRLALRELVRQRASSVSGFVAIALCTLLMGVPPQLRGVLDRDMQAPAAGALPSLFLFDIQPDQVEPLARHVEARGSRLQQVSPMVRARLDSIDGEPVRGDAAGEASGGEARRLRDRRYNLTYRAALTPSEVLREGRPFSGRHDAAADEPAEVSLERDFARRLGVEIGDTLVFDVQGVPVSGQVVNLREVRWNSFQPNFFVLFQPGVLEEAPRIHLASVPPLETREREALQASITEAFPNVSSIDVTRAVRRLLGLISQLQWALASTAALAVAVGAVLVLAVARDQARARRWETNLLKVLGAGFHRIRATVDLEFGLLGGAGALAGSVLAVLASAVLCRFVFDTPYHVTPAPLVAALLGVPALTLAAGRLATRRVLRERPLALLQATPGE